MKKMPMRLIDWFDMAEKKCWSCESTNVHPENYSHSGGWEVEGYTEKQWLFYHCLDCGYDTALWKLGVPRQ